MLCVFMAPFSSPPCGTSIMLEAKPEPTKYPPSPGESPDVKLWEIIHRIDEMAFRRKAVVDRLRALQSQINSDALKIIVYPDSPEVPHWRSELIAWGNGLARMRLRGFRSVLPMGFNLAWNHLYREPFEGAEDEVLRLDLSTIEQEYQRSITKPPAQVLAELTAFLRSFCEMIGQGQPVNSIVNGFGAQTTRVPEAVEE
jgi:hypothetical protein